MIAGHFGFAAVVKSREPQVPLWALMLACQWLDVVFVVLYAAHIETLAPVPGTRGGYGEVIIHADWTHSLVGALALSIVAGALAARPWGPRNGIVVGVVAFSHWVLDLVVHRADLAILPGNVGGLPRLGFGLWRMPSVTFAVEAALVVVGSALYARAAMTAVKAANGSRGRGVAVGAVALGVGAVTLALNALGM